MDSEKINSFLAVVETGSMSGAARRLFCSQSAVSKQVAALEAELGCALFARKGRGLSLTEGGKLAYAFGMRFAQDVRSLQGALYALRLRDGHCVRFAATNYVGTYLVPPALAAYKKAHPERQVSFSIDFLPGVLQLLALDQIAFALVPASKALAGQAHLSLTTVAHDKMTLALPLSHPLAAFARVPCRLLDEAALLVPQEGSATREFALERLADAGVTPHSLIDLGTAQAVCQGVMNGMGAAILSRELTRAHEAAGRLICRDIEGVALTRAICLARRADSALSRQDEEFAKTFRARCGGAASDEEE